MAAEPTETIMVLPVAQNSIGREQSLEQVEAKAPDFRPVPLEDLPADEVKESISTTEPTASEILAIDSPQETVLQALTDEPLEKPLDKEPLPYSTKLLDSIQLSPAETLHEAVSAQTMPSPEDDTTTENITVYEENSLKNRSTDDIRYEESFHELPDPAAELQLITDDVRAEEAEMPFQDQILSEELTVLAEELPSSPEVGVRIVESLKTLEQSKVIELEIVLVEMLHDFELLENVSKTDEEVRTELETRLMSACMRMAELTGIEAKLLIPAEIVTVIASMKLTIPTLEYLQRLQTLGTHEYQLHRTHLLHALKLLVREALFHNWLGRTAIR